MPAVENQPVAPIKKETFGMKVLLPITVFVLTLGLVSEARSQVDTSTAQMKLLSKRAAEADVSRFHQARSSSYFEEALPPARRDFLLALLRGRSGIPRAPYWPEMQPGLPFGSYSPTRCRTSPPP